MKPAPKRRYPYDSSSDASDDDPPIRTGPRNINRQQPQQQSSAGATSSSNAAAAAAATDPDNLWRSKWSSRIEQRAGTCYDDFSGNYLHLNQIATVVGTRNASAVAGTRQRPSRRLIEKEVEKVSGTLTIRCLKTAGFVKLSEASSRGTYILESQQQQQQQQQQQAAPCGSNSLATSSISGSRGAGSGGGSRGEDDDSGGARHHRRLHVALSSNINSSGQSSGPRRFNKNGATNDDDDDGNGEDDDQQQMTMMIPDFLRLRMSLHSRSIGLCRDTLRQPLRVDPLDGRPLRGYSPMEEYVPVVNLCSSGGGSDMMLPCPAVIGRGGKMRWFRNGRVHRLNIGGRAPDTPASCFVHPVVTSSGELWRLIPTARLGHSVSRIPFEFDVGSSSSDDDDDDDDDYAGGGIDNDQQLHEREVGRSVGSSVSRRLLRQNRGGGGVRLMTLSCTERPIRAFTVLNNDTCVVASEGQFLFYERGGERASKFKTPSDILCLGQASSSSPGGGGSLASSSASVVLAGLRNGALKLHDPRSGHFVDIGSASSSGAAPTTAHHTATVVPAIQVGECGHHLVYSVSALQQLRVWDLRRGGGGGGGSSGGGAPIVEVDHHDCQASGTHTNNATSESSSSSGVSSWSSSSVVSARSSPPFTFSSRFAVVPGEKNLFFHFDPTSTVILKQLSLFESSAFGENWCEVDRVAESELLAAALDDDFSRGAVVDRRLVMTAGKDPEFDSPVCMFTVGRTVAVALSV